LFFGAGKRKICIVIVKLTIDTEESKILKKHQESRPHHFADDRASLLALGLRGQGKW
jgi:hypothetical protein